MSSEDAILKKLRYVFGADEGERLFQHTIRQLGVSSIRNEDDELAFGRLLVPQGGLLAVIGRTIITHALLQGASPEPPPRPPSKGGR